MTDVILYFDQDFHGPSLTLHSSDEDLSNNWVDNLFPLRGTWNDAVSSIQVSGGGSAEFYKDIDYNGEPLTLKSGEQISSLPEDFFEPIFGSSDSVTNDSISSVLIRPNEGTDNLIINGSFEQGPDPGAYLPLGPGSKDITDWTVIQSKASPPGLQGAIDYVGTDWRADPGNGSRSLDLNGTPGVGGILQEFDTTPGHQYHVRFDMAGHYSGLPQDMRVSADGQSEIFHFDSKTDPNNLGWKLMSWDFTAHSERTTLAFESLQTEYLYGGPALDEVSVVDVTPATSSQAQPKPTITTPSPTTTTPPTPPTPEFVTLGGIAR